MTQEWVPPNFQASPSDWALSPQSLVPSPGLWVSVAEMVVRYQKGLQAFQKPCGLSEKPISKMNQHDIVVEKYIICMRIYTCIYIHIDYILQCRFIPTWSRFSNWKQHVWSLDMSGLWLVISGFLKRGITRTWWLAIGNNLDRTLGQRMARRHAASLQKSEPQTEMGLDWRRHETSMTHGYQPVYPSMRSKL